MKTLIGLLVIFAINGCASLTKPPTYNDVYSRAYNIADAERLTVGHLKDTVDGKTSNGKSLLAHLTTLGNLATVATAPSLNIRGLNSTQKVIFSAYNAFQSPEDIASRPTLLARIPRHSTLTEEQARTKIKSDISHAINQTASSMEISISPHNHGSPKIYKGQPMLIWLVNAPQYGCYKSKTNCAIWSYVGELYKTNEYSKTPTFVNPNHTDSYALSVTDRKKYSRLFFKEVGDGVTFPHSVFYRELSANMPTWSSLYMPRNTVIENGQLLSYPVIYERGKQLMFIRPKS